MERFIQVVVDGIATGSIYAAMALALVLIFRSTGIVNFAQGEMAMFSTFVAWGLLEAGVPLGLAILITLVLSFVGGMVIERMLIRHVEGGDQLTLVIVTLGLFILLNSLAGWIWGFENRGFPSLFSEDSVDVGGVRSSVESLGIVAVLLGVVGLLFLFFQRTKIGLAMRAAARQPGVEPLVGIRVGRMLMSAGGWPPRSARWPACSSRRACSSTSNLMGGVLIYSFAAATLGGFDSPIGAVVGGWIIGVAENLAGTYVDFIGSDLKILVPLVIIFVVLLVRPARAVRLAGGGAGMTRSRGGGWHRAAAPLRWSRRALLSRSSSAPTASASSRSCSPTRWPCSGSTCWSATAARSRSATARSSRSAPTPRRS